MQVSAPPSSSGPAAVFPGLHPALVVEPNWALIEEGFDLAREHEIESIFTVANGYVGTRGSLPERTSLSAPATFLAGVFEAGPESPPSLDLVVLPDWTRLRIIVEGIPLSLETGEIRQHQRILDLRQGVFLRQWRHQDVTGRVTQVSSMRLVSLHDRHLFLQSVMITPLNYGGTLSVESSLQAPRGRTQWTAKADGDATVLEGTTNRGRRIAMAHQAHVMPAQAEQPAKRTVDADAGHLCERWTWQATMEQCAQFNRFVVVYSTRETEDPAGASRRHLGLARSSGLSSCVDHHTQAWTLRSRIADVQVAGDAAAQRALRFAGYHLTSAVNPHDEHVSIGARALSGSTYKGHVFWDTEIYVLPFYIFTDPPAARALLMYRFHTLPAARERARKFGYGGALYAWESADTGDDVTPDSVVGPDGRVVQILTGLQEHHISADIAYGVWQYWQATADEAFFVAAGADILIETARFWATRGRLEADGRYHIRTVIGPDEYHESVDDNAYTNVLAQWNLERAAEAADWLRSARPDAWETISARLAIRPEEPAAWRRLAQAVYTGFDPRTNLFEQFAGYFQLEDLDLDAYRARTVPIDVVLGRERTQQSKVVKQADVIALSPLLWDRFPHAVHEANFRYYEPRTAHGSSLSPAFHALVSARLGDGDLALRYFHETASIDLSNQMGNAAGGIHIASLGGLWQAAVFGMGGVRLRDNGLVIDPHLPATWEALSFCLQWRARIVTVSIHREPGQVTVVLQAGDPMTIALNGGTAAEIHRDHVYIADRAEAGWNKWRASSTHSSRTNEKGVL